MTFEQKQDYHKQWVEHNRERCREYERRRREKDPDKEHERQRLKRLKFPDKERLRTQQWRLDNPDRHKALVKKWNTDHKERRRELAMNWRRANPDKRRVSRARNRVKRRGVEGSHTSADIRRIFCEQEGLCLWCRQELSSDFHIDHVIPLSKGGTDFPGNLCLACPSCNLAKRNTLPLEWLLS